MFHAIASTPPEAARIMFQRYLAAWAMDLLELRRLGLDRPGVRPDRCGAPVAPPARARLESTRNPMVAGGRL